MKLLKTALLSLTVVSIAQADLNKYAEYRKAVKEVEMMSRNQANQKLVKDYGLSLLNVAWEDTGRGKNSALGPNISDVTIQAHTINENGEKSPVSMPIVRYPNFDDKSADISADKFFLSVGNEKNDTLKQISLTEYLNNLPKYLSKPSSWKSTKEVEVEGKKETKKIDRTLLSARDTHVLVSAQVAFLPVPKQGTAEFNPVIFNYQSAKESPAVLTILSTREGTSATIIDNTRDAFESNSFRMGQRLFFNENGQRASLTAVRQADFNGTTKGPIAANLNAANGHSGLNMVLMIQVPLKHKNRGFLGGGFMKSLNMLESAMPSSVDNAVIGHGKVEGPFTEIDGLAIERDERFPVRVTVQFYKATDSQVLTEEDVKAARTQIDRVYKNADFVGSLVTEGKTVRPTDHNVKWCYDLPWWPIYWNSNPGVISLEGEKTDTVATKEEAISLLQRHYPNGAFWPYICRGPIYFKNAVQHALELSSIK